MPTLSYIHRRGSTTSTMAATGPHVPAKDVTGLGGSHGTRPNKGKRRKSGEVWVDENAGVGVGGGKGKVHVVIPNAIARGKVVSGGSSGSITQKVGVSKVNETALHNRCIHVAQKAQI